MSKNVLIAVDSFKTALIPSSNIRPCSRIEANPEML
jgi:hypothetical protein